MPLGRRLSPWKPLPSCCAAFPVVALPDRSSSQVRSRRPALSEPLGKGPTAPLQTLAQPKAGGLFPAVLVCDENRALVEHIRDVTRRLAKAGFTAPAVDRLSREGGTAMVDPAQVPGRLTANPAQNVSASRAAFGHLQALGSVQKSNIGMVGFCFGGGVTWMVATAIRN